MTFPVFASGDILRAADMNAVGLWLVKTQTIGNAVSSVTVTNAFSSAYDNYQIVISGGVASTTSVFRMALGSVNTGYYAYGVYGTYAAGGPSNSNTNNGTTWLDVGSGTTSSLNMNVMVIGPNLARVTHFYSQYAVSTTPPNGYFQVSGGYNTSTLQHTDFTITPSSGTLTGGEIRVYGFRN